MDRFFVEKWAQNNEHWARRRIYQRSLTMDRFFYDVSMVKSQTHQVLETHIIKPWTHFLSTSVWREWLVASKFFATLHFASATSQKICPWSNNITTATD